MTCVSRCGMCGRAVYVCGIFSIKDIHTHIRCICLHVGASFLVLLFLLI
jgi:hypothetical protein